MLNLSLHKLLDYQDDNWGWSGSTILCGRCSKWAYGKLTFSNFESSKCKKGSALADSLCLWKKKMNLATLMIVSMPVKHNRIIIMCGCGQLYIDVQ
jgi:hypothetical protein